MVCDGAAAAGVDPVALLALIRAESGLDSHAERWGAYTTAAKAAIRDADYVALARLIALAFPDISFGYTQRIVLYSYHGDRSASVANCLAVRQYVFDHPIEDIREAAAWLADAYRKSADGSALGALCAYNAGSDRRSDPQWMARWGGNVANYEAALAWAEGYRSGKT